MKMSEDRFERLKKFYDMTVENANDNDVDFLLMSIGNAVKAKKMELEGVSKEEINYDNPRMSKIVSKTIRDFFEEFLKYATDDEAIYLIEGLKAIRKEYRDHPDKVAKFVMERKKAMAENVKKS